MLTVENLTVKFGNRTIFQNADAVFAPSVLTALVGRNGSGKSTLMHIIAGIGVPYSGRLLFDGTDMRGITHSRLARTVAYVGTRRVRVTDMTCRQSVAMGRSPYTNWLGHLSAEDKSIVDESLRLTGMSDFSGRALDKLSDGEYQRVMIAQALAQQTPVIMLDEPTSFLDVPSRRRLCALLRTLAHDSGKCIVFSTHELDLAEQYADFTALIDNQKISVMPAAAAETAKQINRAFGI